MIRDDKKKRCTKRLNQYSVYLFCRNCDTELKFDTYGFSKVNMCPNCGTAAIDEPFSCAAEEGVTGPHKVPEEYLFHRDSGGKIIRKLSPKGEDIDQRQLEDIFCPFCGEQSLRHDYDSPSQHYVRCEHESCIWMCPGGYADCYEESAKGTKEWVEVFHLIGRPKELENEDITLLLFPEGEWREEVRERRKRWGRRVHVE